MVRTGDDHHLLSKVCSVFLGKVNSFGFKAFKSVVNNARSSFDDEFSSVDLSLSLLNLEEALSYLNMVGELHEFHSSDVDTSIGASYLKDLSQLDTNKFGV